MAAPAFITQIVARPTPPTHGREYSGYGMLMGGVAALASLLYAPQTSRYEVGTHRTAIAAAQPTGQIFSGPILPSVTPGTAPPLRPTLVVPTQEYRDVNASFLTRLEPPSVLLNLQPPYYQGGTQQVAFATSQWPGAIFVPSPAPIGIVPIRPGPGPGISPNLETQFTTPPLSRDPATIVAAVAGIAVSHSVSYGQMGIAVPIIGFTPVTGPSLLEPFNGNQFIPPPLDTSQPSPLTTNLAGVAASTSVGYGLLTGAGELDGLSVSVSVSYGNGTALPAGSMSGIAISHSVSYGNLLGTGALSGYSQSASLTLAQGVGSGFQPYIPNTAVVDVRLGVGYQPWQVNKRDDVIG